MNTQAFGKLDKKLEGFLWYPGIDQKNLLARKNLLIAASAIFCQVVGLTIYALIVAPSLIILLTYGILLYLQLVAYYVIVKFSRRNFSTYLYINQFILILSTFVNILLLGGIPTSGGLIMVGIAASLMGISLEQTKVAYWLFGTYVMTLLFAGILQPWLTVPPAMTTQVNVTLYVVNTLCLSLFTFIFMINLIKQNIRYEQRETMRLQELDKIKSKFFTNISHEFRTPLTIIMGMANLIRESPEKWISEGTEKIRNSGQDLLDLVNQILDLSKLESEAMPLHFMQEDIIGELRHITGTFSSIAMGKNINLKFIPSVDRFVMDVDHEKLLFIVSNLLSNALKYSYEGGSVELSSQVAGLGGDQFIIKVRDHGKGIKPVHLPFIFNRFYRVEENGTEVGHGLGLTLTKELIKLLRGEIYVESVPGEGSVFTVLLPVTRSAGIHGLAVKAIGAVAQDSPLRGAELEFSLPEGTSEDDGRPLLLLVEDNTDLIRYLIALLSADYRIEVAGNGKEGLDKALELVPDLILSDVMMPLMDGIEMLDKVKNDMRTSHIPVVMLTAKADLASKIEGLCRGADEYLAKPFREEELHVRLKNLIGLRKKLQERYASMGPPPITTDMTFQLEDEFIQKIRQVMEVNLDDDSFGILQLCKTLGMSRAQLYRKFKTLTDKTVNEYLRSFRLHKARELLLTTNLNVSEVAFDVGFKNLSHFSKIFTEEYGKNPKEIGKQKG